MKWGSLASIGDEPVSHNAKIKKRVILRRGEVPHLTQIARASFPPGEIAPAHVHPDMWELFICETGEGTITINDGEIKLSPGTWVLVEPGDTHEISSSKGSQLILSVFGLERSSHSIG